MIGPTNKAVMACLGIFLGLILFGVSVSLTHFNRLVDPRHPLQLLERQTEEEQRGISLWGEKLSLQFDWALPGRLAQQAGDKAQPVMYDLRGHIDALKHEISAGHWPEKAVSAAQEARSLLPETWGRLKGWLDDYEF